MVRRGSRPVLLIFRKCLSIIFRWTKSKACTRSTLVQPYCGRRRTREWHRRFNARAVIFGTRTSANPGGSSACRSRKPRSAIHRSGTLVAASAASFERSVDPAIKSPTLNATGMLPWAVRNMQSSDRMRSPRTDFLEECASDDSTRAQATMRSGAWIQEKANAFANQCLGFGGPPADRAHRADRTPTWIGPAASPKAPGAPAPPRPHRTPLRSVFQRRLGAACRAPRTR